MSESTGEVTVTVEPPDAPDTAPVEDAPDVVVVDTGDTGSGNSDATVELAATLGALVEKVNGLEAQIGEAIARATVAEVVAEEALEEAETPVVVEEPEVVEPPEEDEGPHKPHFVHRSFSDLFKSKS